MTARVLIRLILDLYSVFEVMLPVILPIESILRNLTDTLKASTNAVLIAAPGAGKTTRVPLALLQEPWLAGRRILMLEPRRLAARAAAFYMANSLAEQVGETVGYRVKHDTKAGPQTRLEVITEGVLTRMLQADPALEGVGIVIFDEFHERSIHVDLGLALCLQSQAVLREDLRILVMSATLEAEPVARLLNDAPILISEGRSFPVETCYLDRRADGRSEPLLVKTICDALGRDQGDILVFLPGAGEIRQVETQLKELALGQGVQIAPLHGNLSQEAQDLAITPSSAGQRKIVLATAIAETSLTVEGIGVVIDSGLMRVPRFSPRTGMTRLETVTVSRASADQRRGRAGRLGPGVCYRLWTRQEDVYLQSFSNPGILDADLASLALELAMWGVQNPLELCWLNPPPAAAFAQAQDLLYQLGAIHREGTITQHGRNMAVTGLHPRLAHMILQALPLELGGLACELAVLLSERDIFKGKAGKVDTDLRLRVEALRKIRHRKQGEVSMPFGCTVDFNACRRIITEIDYWQRELRVSPNEQDDLDACGLLLAFAYPDRIAQGRGDGRFLLQNGRGAVIPQEQLLSQAAYLVAAQLEDKGADSRIFLAATVDPGQIRQHLSGQIIREASVVWDRIAKAVRGRCQERLGAIILKSFIIPKPDKKEILTALLQGIAETGLDILPWTRAACQLRQRLQFMRQLEPGWPDMSDEALIATLSEWLAPFLEGMSCEEDLQRLNLMMILDAMLSWEQRRELDEYAPTHLLVPSGQRVPIDYSDPGAPVLAVRLQEMFGLERTPAIAKGRVILILHLLSPAQRPIQITRDLANFWRNTYIDVKKDLMGRYPKHYWPDDPLTALPTNRTRPQPRKCKEQ